MSFLLDDFLGGIWELTCGLLLGCLWSVILTTETKLLSKVTKTAFAGIKFSSFLSVTFLLL